MTSNIAYAAYFDVDGLWPTQIDNNRFPNSQRAFQGTVQAPILSLRRRARAEL